MKGIPIESARRIAEAAGADRIVIVAVGPGGDYAATSWAATQADCHRLGRYLDRKGLSIALGIERETRGQ